MATGFDKFKGKTLEESGINITPTGSKQFQQTRVGGGGQKPRPAPQQETKPAAEKTAPVKEDTFQLTIVIKKELKRKLDEIKFVHQKSYKEIAEEAFEAIYAKYIK